MRRLGHHVRKRQARDAGGVGVQQQEVRIVVQQGGAVLQQARHVLEQSPDLACGAAPVFGRVQDDSMILRAATDFAGDVFACVLDDPADRSVGQARQLGVFARIGHGLLGGVDVSDLGPGCGGGQAGHAGVAEQVEDLGRIACWAIALRAA